MSNYHPFYHKIWEDNKFLDYDPYKKLVFVYLFTNSNCKISGIYEISPRTISYATNLPLDQIKDILKDFDDDTLLYDFSKSIVYLKNYFKYNIGKIGNPITVNKTILQNVKMYPHPTFWKDFNTRYVEELTKITKRIADIEEKKKPDLQIVK